MSPHLLIALLGFAFLTGCATLDEDECRSADWFDLGLRDGLAGKPLSRLADHRKACSEYGIAPIEARYRNGRDDGLLEYCRLENAFRTGLRGERYQGVCPAAVDLVFRDYNDAAYLLYKTRTEIKRLDEALRDREEQVLDKKLSDKKRDELWLEIRNLDRQRDQLRHDLRQQQRQLDWLMDEARARRLP